MQSPTPENLKRFLAELGRRCIYPASIYIFGGAAHDPNPRSFLT